MSLDMLNILGVMVNIIDWMEGGGVVLYDQFMGT